MRVLTNLSDLFHLLTTQEEMTDLGGTDMISILEKSITGGLPNKDGSTKDSAEFLDELSSILSKKDVTTGIPNLSVLNGGFFYMFAVAHLARNLASSSLNCECGLEKMKHRMKTKNIDPSLRIDIVSVAFLLMKGNGDAANLAVAVIDVCVREMHLVDSISDWKTGDNYDDKVWNLMIKSLQESFETN
jgi:hypothetical protein